MDAFHGAFAFAAICFCPLPILDIAVVRIVTIAIAMQCRALGALHLQGIGRVVRVLRGDGVERAEIRCHPSPGDTPCAVVGTTLNSMDWVRIDAVSHP